VKDPLSSGEISCPMWGGSKKNGGKKKPGEEKWIKHGRKVAEQKPLTRNQAPASGHKKRKTPNKKKKERKDGTNRARKKRRRWAASQSVVG